MSAKKEKEKQHRHEGRGGDDDDQNAIPQWATHRIQPVDDPFHDDFEVEIVLKHDDSEYSSENDE